LLTAITRAVSPAINRCELGYLPRQEIDFAKAAEQHRRYEDCLRELGLTVVSLPAEPALPDSMFVEDPVVVVKEVAVMTRMGAESRRAESESLAEALARYRPLRWLRAPATLEGGDVLRIGKTLYVGLSARTNQAGIAQLAEELRPFGYAVRAVAVRGCLHLKSACCSLGDRAILVNREWMDTAPFEGLTIIDVPASEPRAANVLTIGDTVLAPESFPETVNVIEQLDWKVRTLDISELMKAEAGLTCSSIVLETG
jgi:dimethylargininase